MVLWKINFLYDVGSTLEMDVEHLKEGALIVAVDSEEGDGKVQGLKHDSVFDMGGRFGIELSRICMVSSLRAYLLNMLSL